MATTSPFDAEAFKKSFPNGIGDVMNPNSYAGLANYFKDITPKSLNDSIAKSNPALYESMRQSALENIRKSAVMSGYQGGGGATGFTPQTVISLQKDYQKLIDFGFTPEFAKANSYDIANAGFAQDTADQAKMDKEQSFGDVLKNMAKSPAGQIFLAIALPGVGASIGASLTGAGVMTSAASASAAATAAGATAAGAAAAGAAATATATTIGTAIASTAVNVAQGQKFEDALKNSIVNAAVSTGSLAVAKEANALIGHPAVTDAIISAAGSAAKTAAAGGTEQDIINNMTGALAGSAASSAYQLGGEDFTRSTGRVLGSAVAGGVTGGGVGAITGALGELGGQAKGNVSDTLRGVSDTGALPESQVAAMTPASDVEFETKTITFPRSTDITSTNIISPNASITAPAAAALEPTGITDTEVMNAISSEKTPAAAAPAEEVVRREATASENAGFPLVEVTAQRLPPPPPDITSTDIIDTPAQLDDVTITGKREETPLNVAAVEEPATVEEPPPEEKPPADKPYKPNLFILGGKQPKAPTKPSTSVLGQALGTTTGLTASRGAGEIEDPSTGKKRKKVWNEETLRLKDALGV